MTIGQAARKAFVETCQEEDLLVTLLTFLLFLVVLLFPGVLLLKLICDAARELDGPPPPTLKELFGGPFSPSAVVNGIESALLLVLPGFVLLTVLLVSMDRFLAKL